MRIYVAAIDVHPADLIANCGEVEAVSVVGDDVVFTMHWSVSREYRLAIDAECWVDRPDPVPSGGAA